MDPFGFSLDLGARASVLLGLTALALLALRRAPAGARQTVALAGMAGALALTPLSLAMPRCPLLVLPAAVLEASAAPVHDAVVRFLLGGWLALVWGVGAAFSLSRLAFGMWRVARCARRGTRLDEAGIARAAAKLGLRSPVRVVLSGEVKVPITAGFQQPVIVLPAAAAGWCSERLELVLLHELAHVKRRDCLAMMVAEIAVASWWFHPLAWLARRNLRRNAEQAADDLVLSTGARPSVYAGHLLSIVRSLREPEWFGAALAMGRASDLDGRLRALLERRGRGLSPRLGRGIAAGLAGLGLAFGAVWPVHGPQPRPVCMRSSHGVHR
jgi:beta-lactamase regulating signal transducer with metallopeptidase domain